MRKKIFLVSVFLLFSFRLLYGLCSEFWFVDQLQIYLIGLKYYATGIWPYFGTDLVYTKSQMPGALLGLLTGLPLRIFPIVEAPVFVVNILTFFSLGFFSWYVTRRIPQLPDWFVWLFVMTSPWTLLDGTSVFNLAYLLIFSVIFFISAWECSGIYPENIVNTKFAFFLMGLCLTCIFQLHMSWVILGPFILASAYSQWRLHEKFFAFIKTVIWFIPGFLAGISLVIPTLMEYGLAGTGGTEKSVVFNILNFKNLFVILARFLSFASFEVPYMLGPNTAARIEVVKNNIWMAPSTVFLLAAGIIQVIFYISAFFIKDKGNTQWKYIRYFTLASWLLIFVSFFFSVKGPASHAFFIMLPVSVYYAFYCYSFIFSYISKKSANQKNTALRSFNYKKMMYAVIFIYFISGFIFHAGLMFENFKTKSIYKNRALIQKAIDEKDYKILGLRRSDIWGSGY